MKLIEKIFYHSSNKVLNDTIMKIILVLKILPLFFNSPSFDFAKL